MIAGCCHDEMEIAASFVTIAVGHNRLKGCRRLFECDPCLVWVTIEL
ncbi:hypothetical protein PT7_0574 [Pusillimonas sp. T7-7]|nr:hypothetical protein PT7_0574 [Pusillimonas sp. T7-7]